MFNSFLEIMTQLNSVNCMNNEDNYQFLKKEEDSDKFCSFE